MSQVIVAPESSCFPIFSRLSVDMSQVIVAPESCFPIFPKLSADMSHVIVIPFAHISHFLLFHFSMFLFHIHIYIKCRKLII